MLEVTAPSSGLRSVPGFGCAGFDKMSGRRDNYVSFLGSLGAVGSAFP